PWLPPARMAWFSKPERVGFGDAGFCMLRSDGGDRGGLVEPEKGIELLRERRVGVMAHQFGVGPIDHADKALQALGFEGPSRSTIAQQIDDEAYNTGIVELPLVTVVARGIDAFDLQVAAPVGRRGDSPGIGAHADQRDLILSEFLPAELADIELVTHRAHFSMPRISDVGVVGPNYGLGRG